MMNFEMCPRCCHIHELPVERLKPMVLSGDNKRMQCNVCGCSFPLRDYEAIIELARHQKGGIDMAAKGRIYKIEGTIENSELLDQLNDAFTQLREKMKATIPVFKGIHQVGFGVNKAQRGIAADQIISIARAIKSLSGW